MSIARRSCDMIQALLFFRMQLIVKLGGYASSVSSTLDFEVDGWRHQFAIVYKQIWQQLLCLPYPLHFSSEQHWKAGLRYKSSMNTTNLVRRRCFLTEYVIMATESSNVSGELEWNNGSILVFIGGVKVQWSHLKIVQQIIIMICCMQMCWWLLTCLNTLARTVENP